MISENSREGLIMTEKELQKSGRLYKPDAELWAAHLNAKRLTRLLNSRVSPFSHFFATTIGW